MSLRVRIGLAAWSNKHFDHALYPIRTLHSEYLPRYAKHFDMAEIGRFYHEPIPAEEQRAWADQTPDGFTFLPKLPSDATGPLAARIPGHRPGGADAEAWRASAPARIEAAKQARDGLTELEAAGKRGPFLAQFPPSFRASAENRDLLAQLLGCFQGGDVAVELRHSSWWTRETRAVMEDAGAALVWSTYPGADVPDWTTADFGYLRFVGMHHKTRGRHPTVEDRLMDLLELRGRLQGVGEDAWSACYVVVTNGFEGNAVDSLPRIAAALGRSDVAKAVSRRPGQPMLR